MDIIKDFRDLKVKEASERIKPILDRFDYVKTGSIQNIICVWMTKIKSGKTFDEMVEEIRDLFPFIVFDENKEAISLFKVFQIQLALTECLLPLSLVVQYRRCLYDPSGVVQEIKEITSKVGQEASIEDAFNYLVKLDSVIRNVYLSIPNNSSLLKETIENHDLEGFYTRLSETQIGAHELLCICRIDILLESLYAGEYPLNYLFKEEEEEAKSFVKKYFDFFYSSDHWLVLPEKLKKRYLNIIASGPVSIDDLLNFYRILADELMNSFKGDIQFFSNYGDPIGFILYINVLCKKPYSEYVLPIFFKKLEELGISIKTEILDRCDPEHIIVAEAKKYLEKRESSPVKKTKGRKKSSWIKTMTNCPEEALGRLFRDEIWPGLKKRLQKFTYKDVNGIELRGKDLDTAISALGACFIFYVVDSLGFADRKWVSYEKTTKLFLSVSRNTIISYMKILDEYGRWLKKDRSNLDVFEHENPKYYKLLLNNLNSFTETISYLTPRIKQLFEEHLTMKSNN